MKMISIYIFDNLNFIFILKFHDKSYNYAISLFLLDILHNLQILYLILFTS